jgi:hypothetical protein
VNSPTVSSERNLVKIAIAALNLKISLSLDEKFIRNQFAQIGAKLSN